jgi:hypothetical protein
MNTVVSQRSVSLRVRTLLPSLPLLVAAGLCGCDFPLKPKPKPQAPVVEKIATPEPIQRIQGDRLKIHEALRFEDVSFMVRSGTPEEEVVAAIKKRGLVDSVTPTQVKVLTDAGASAKIMAAIKEPRHVLTKQEVIEYHRREQERNLANRVRGYVDEQQRAVDFAERQRQIDAQQKTMAAVAQKEREVKEYEKAKRDYEARRTHLENEKQRLQALMNSYRKAGYSEQSIGTIAQELKKVEDERAKLKSP